VFAHHGNAAYDGSVVELKNATVTKLSCGRILTRSSNST